MVAGTISGYPKKKKILFLSSQQLWTRIRKKKWKSMEWKKNAGGDELCVNVNAESLIIRLSLVKIVKCDVWWRSFFRIWTISRRTHTHTLYLGAASSTGKKENLFCGSGRTALILLQHISRFLLLLSSDSPKTHLKDCAQFNRHAKAADGVHHGRFIIHHVFFLFPSFSLFHLVDPSVLLPLFTHRERERENERDGRTNCVCDCCVCGREADRRVRLYYLCVHSTRKKVRRER